MNIKIRKLVTLILAVIFVFGTSSCTSAIQKTGDTAESGKTSNIYKVASDTNLVFAQNKRSTLTVNDFFENFKSVTVDGKELLKDDFYASSSPVSEGGFIQITLLDSFLSSLKTGKHKIEVTTKTGSTGEVEFTVTEPVEIPQEEETTKNDSAGTETTEPAQKAQQPENTTTSEQTTANNSDSGKKADTSKDSSKSDSSGKNNSSSVKYTTEQEGSNGEYVVCGYCGWWSNHTYSECPNCGKAWVADSDHWVCSNCGTFNRKSDKYCTHPYCRYTQQGTPSLPSEGDVWAYVNNVIIPAAISKGYVLDKSLNADNSSWGSGPTIFYPEELNDKLKNDVLGLLDFRAEITYMPTDVKLFNIDVVLVEGPITPKQWEIRPYFMWG